MWTDKIGCESLVCTLMLDHANVSIGMLPVHNRWEFYMYNAVFGLFQAPYYAYSQTMLSEILPPGTYDSKARRCVNMMKRPS
jgi:MFS-type transporter involved in bile tolerance (Atg22 family)